MNQGRLLFDATTKEKEKNTKKTHETTHEEKKG